MARYTPNWMQNGTYPAQLDRLLLMDAMGTPNSCLLSGTGAFAVTATGTTMVLSIAPGRGMVVGNFIANQGNYEIFSDAVENVTIGTAPGAGLSRIDLVIAQVRDAFVDGGGFSDFIFTTVPGTAATTGSQVAPTAPADSMTLAQVLVGPGVTSIAQSNVTDSRPYMRGPSVVQTVPALAANQSYTITHNLNTQNLLVQLWDAVTTMLVMAQVDIIDNNNISVSVTAATPNAINAVIYGASPAPTPVLASDLAPKAYVDARTPNLPAPVTGTTIQTFTDALGDVWVAKGNVAGGVWKRARDALYLRYGRNAALTLAVAWTTWTYDLMSYDNYGMYSAGTWTAPVAGMYYVRTSAMVSATAIGQNIQIAFDNPAGTMVIGTLTSAVGADYCAVLASGIIQANAGDAWTTKIYASAALPIYVGTGFNIFDLAYLGTG